jgi:hypothetical protein
MNELPPDILHCIGNASLLACATPRVAVICQRRTWLLAPERLLNFQGIGKRCNLEKHGWRNIKSFAQFLDVRLIEGTFLMFIPTASAAASPACRFTLERNNLANVRPISRYN